MRPGGPPTLDRGEAMPVERGRLRGGSEALIALRVARSERIALQKLDLLVEQRLVTGRGDVVRGREGKPEQVVGAARTGAAAGLRMPPVQHVPDLELAPGGVQDVRAAEAGSAVHESHHVLELVAKAKGTAGLIEARSCPESTRERLVEKPAVDHQVQRRVRGVHL